MAAPPSSAPASAGPSAVIFGATGAVGKPLLSELVSSPHYSQVHAFVRRPFKADSPHKDEAKLIEHIVDFDKLVNNDTEQVKSIRDVGAEAVYITLGTTRAQAGSADAFVKIDRQYVLAAAKAALCADSASKQRVLYCSASMASSKSPLLYPQSKGLTEEGLAKLGYSDCLLFRPGYLANPQREKKRMAEEVFGFLVTNIGARFSSSLEIKVKDLAKAMLTAGIQGSAGVTTLGAGNPPSDSFSRAKDTTVTVVSNSEAKRLVKEA